MTGAERSALRAERVAEAQRLRAEGLLLREIADRMGVHLKTVSEWLCDPDGTRGRAIKRRAEDRARAACADCGAPMGAGSAWRGERRCRPCEYAARERRAYTRALCIADLWEDGLLLREIADIYGWDVTRAGVEFAHIRKRWPELLPHRYPMRDGKRVAA